jgi:hypothetical protein
VRRGIEPIWTAAIARDRQLMRSMMCVVEQAVAGTDKCLAAIVQLVMATDVLQPIC